MVDFATGRNSGFRVAENGIVGTVGTDFGVASLGLVQGGHVGGVDVGTAVGGTCTVVDVFVG